MASPILSLSSELHLLIYGGLNDLDDARDLARSCTYFYNLQRTHKRAIAKTIILTSNVYEYDVCVAKLHFVEQDLARMYEQHGSDPQSKFRLHKDVFYACLDATRDPVTLTVGVIDVICRRWQKTRLLRELYSDAKIFADFDFYREDFIKVASDHEPPEEFLVDGGIETMDLVTSGFDRVNDLGLPMERTLLHEWEDDFTARFHRSLCLHSIAISSRMIVKAVAECTDADTDDILDKACDAWAKAKVTIGGHEIQLTLAEKVDSLETWDFIYNFLLRKLFPLSVMSDWMMACKADIMLHDDYGDIIPSQVCGYFLDALRWALHPEDIVDAIVGQAWKRKSTFGGDKCHFMAVRGLFDWDAAGDADFYTFHSRMVMVESLNIWALSDCDHGEAVYPWDRFRAEHGSPFNPDFDWSVLMNEANKGDSESSWSEKSPDSEDSPDEKLPDSEDSSSEQVSDSDV